MIQIIFSLLIFLFYSSLNSEEIPDDNSYLFDLEGMPSSMVAGCVNAITGNYSESHLDLQVTGANPLQLICSYNSSKQDKGTLCSGWDINLPGDATGAIGQSEKQAVVNHGGSSYSFSGTTSHEKTQIDKQVYKYGVTNAHNGRLTAREKLANTKFSFSKSHKHAELILSPYERIEFKEHKVKDDVIFEYTLKTHYFPNRCKYEYSYKDGKLSKVYTVGEKSDQILGFLSFLYPKKYSEDPRLTILTNDDRSVEYHFTKVIKNRYYLDYIDSPNLPRRQYKYYIPEKTDIVKLCSSELPDSRVTNIQYYEKDMYRIWGREFIVSGKKDSRFGRVSVLRQPTGTDSSLIDTFSFIYHLDKDKVSSKPIGGYTEAFDAYGNKTIYFFSKEHRLEEIQSFRSNGELYRREEITWGKDSDYTLLKKRSLLDSNGKIYLSRAYTYDERGNSINETISGDLTGNQGIENYKKSFSYTKYDQIASEKEGRKEIQYTYYAKSDLVATKFVLEYSNIKQRVFFDYDAKGTLISEIIDDGCNSSIDDLSGVTQRSIKQIQSNSVGLPEVVSEYGLDMATKQKVLLRKTVNEYTREGYLIQQKIFDSHGDFAYSKSWSYNALGKVTSESDPLGQVTHYDYDANGNCIFKKIDNTEYYTIFVYDYSNRLIREENVYNDGLQLAKTYSYDLRGNKTAETDIYGNTTNYEYDEFNRLVEIKRLQGATEKIAYDVLNNVTAKIDGNGNVTQFSYTALGKPCRIEYPDGSCERSIYNTDGTLQRLILPNGSYISYHYDYQKRVTAERTYSPNGYPICHETRQYNTFNLISQTDKKGNVTYFSYDLFGRVISAKTNEMETRFVYDSLGRQSEIWELISKDNYKKTINVFDLLDRVVEERIEDSQGNLLSKKAYAYDAQGNKTHETIFTSQGETTKITEYNGQNLPVKIIHPNGEISYIFNDFNYYDAWGHCVAYQETIDPKGNRMAYIYNPQGKLAAEEYYSPVGTLLKKLSYRYDLAGNLVQRLEDIIVDNEITDTIMTTLEYDSRNRETGIIKAYGRPEQKIFRKEYTHFDEISRQIKPDGNVIDYIYDCLGRLIEVYDSFNTIHYVYTYDLADNVLSVVDKMTQTTTTRVYDRNDLLISEILDNGLQLQYQHDFIGRTQKLILPDHSCISYAYDALNLSSITRKDCTQTFEYDLSGRPTRIGMINYEYDHALRLKNVRSNFFSQTIPEGGYDQNNNILTLNQSDSLGEVSSTYTYDGLDQLTSEDGIATHTYEYDSRQNRSKKDEKVYENDILSQLIKQGNASYTYDCNGNRHTLARPNSSITCEYDAMDRLIKVTNGDIQVQYRYDAFNRRISKTTKAGETRYLYCGDTEIGSVDSQGQIQELMIAAGSQPVMLEIAGKTYLTLQDHRQNVVALVDPASHTAVETYRYSAFGEEEQSSALSPWRFSSKRVDPETGWVYFGRRYYDPEVGRWTTPDPIWFEDGPNLYAYVQNNPIIFVDPNGLKHQKAHNHKNHRKFHHYEKIASVFKWFMGPFGLFPNFCHEESRTYEVGDKKSKIALCFINGIFNSFAGAQESAGIVSEAAGGAYVRGVYNCSYGVLDLVECALGLMRIDTDPVAELHKLWNEEFDRVGPDGVIAQICHSQGAIHVRNALETYDPEKRMRIFVLAVAPACYISEEICRGIRHLVSNRDFVPYFDYNGRKINKETIVFLEKHIDAFFIDHLFSSPTYRKEILDWVEKIYEKQGVSI